MCVSSGEVSLSAAETDEKVLFFLEDLMVFFFLNQKVLNTAAIVSSYFG